MFSSWIICTDYSGAIKLENQRNWTGSAATKDSVERSKTLCYKGASNKLLSGMLFISKDRHILPNDALAAACVNQAKIFISAIFTHLTLSAQNKFPQAINRCQECFSFAACRDRYILSILLIAAWAALWKSSVKIATLDRKTNLTKWFHALTRARARRYNQIHAMFGQGTSCRFLSHKSCSFEHGNGNIPPHTCCSNSRSSPELLYLCLWVVVSCDK